MGLSEKDREMLTSDVNIIINSAGNVDMASRLDLAVKVNVFGALQLLDLAEECRQFDCFCQVSTCYAVIDDKDNTDGIEEKMHTSPYDWGALYKMITEMTINDIVHYQKNIIARFPNTYTFSKRMAEHLLVENNKKNLPICIIRPSIIGATLSEPFPGWTDSIGIIGGLIMIAGMGILRELPGNENNIGDAIPVDMVVS